MSAPAASAGGPVLRPLSGRRRRTDKAMQALLGAGTALALIPLVLIVVFLLIRGFGALSWDFFTTDPNGNFLGFPGGIRSAILGTIEIIGLATLISLPIGVGVAIWLVEYGKRSRFAQVVRYVIDVMTGVPSVVFGLFVYITLVISGGGFAGWKGALAVSLLMLPIVTRSAEVVLQIIPDSLREGALALGAPRWRVVFKVVLPTALPGIVTGSLLAIARGAGETAPLLFTALGASALTFNLDAQINALPLQVFQDVQQAQQRLVDRAWGAALTLVLMILILTVIARLVQRRSRLR